MHNKPETQYKAEMAMVVQVDTWTETEAGGKCA